MLSIRLLRRKKSLVICAATDKITEFYHMKIFVFQTHGLTEKMTYIHSMDIFLSLFKDKRWFIIFSFLLTFLPSKKINIASKNHKL